jgi:hypothetical protein
MATAPAPADPIALLEPLDVFAAVRLLKDAGVAPRCLVLDPWYNKGVGGERVDYQDFIDALLAAAAGWSEHAFLWGFPEIVAPVVTRLPPGLELVAWLTWYYKNSPSVIRGWRSSQHACLHLAAPGARLHPEHFLTPAQREKQARGKLRYMPGPTSVIEEPLLVGFVGRGEQTGHPAQKPVAVLERLVRMTTVPGDLVVDPMAGSGTTAAACRRLGRRCVVSDRAEEYVALMERRLGVRRAPLPTGLV